MRVLIVEDERDMAQVLKVGLEEENHLVSLAFDGLSGLEMARACDFDVIVLDVMLPKLDGFEVARRLRAKENRTPILMLTARDTVPDVVKGLDLGADDYLTKPFSFAVLLARLRAASRRQDGQPTSLLRVADLVLNQATMEVFRGRHEINLTATELSATRSEQAHSHATTANKAALNCLVLFSSVPRIRHVFVPCLL